MRCLDFKWDSHQKNPNLGVFPFSTKQQKVAMDKVYNWKINCKTQILINHAKTNFKFQLQEISRNWYMEDFA